MSINTTFKTALSSVAKAATAQTGLETKLIELLSLPKKEGNHEASLLLTAMSLQSFGSATDLVKFFSSYTNFQIVIAEDNKSFVSEEGRVLSPAGIKHYEENKKPLVSFKDWVINQLTGTEFEPLLKRLPYVSLFIVKGFKEAPSNDAKDSVKATYENRKTTWEAFKAQAPLAQVVGKNLDGSDLVKDIPTNQGISVFMADLASAKRAATREFNAANQSQDDKDTKALKRLETALTSGVESLKHKAQDAIAKELCKSATHLVVKPTSKEEMDAVKAALTAAGLAHLIVK